MLLLDRPDRLVVFRSCSPIYPGKLTTRPANPKERDDAEWRNGRCCAAHIQCLGNGRAEGVVAVIAPDTMEAESPPFQEQRCELARAADGAALIYSVAHYVIVFFATVALIP